MATRLELQSKLEELIGSRNVYYQPPESLKLEYPCIVYSKSDMEANYANNQKYSRFKSYSLTVIAKKPDNEIIDKLLNLPYCSYDRNYKTDNLEHDVLTLYY